MVKQFHILPEAEQDAADAYGWYEERQPGLGEEFLRCVEACIQSIRRNPKTYSVVHESYRRALLRRFPYAVFYEYAEEPSRFTPSSIARKTHKSGVFGCRKERTERQLTNALHWTPALLQFGMNPKGRVLAGASDCGR
jgi:plasmid stabilization system protein ParE